MNAASPNPAPSRARALLAALKRWWHRRSSSVEHAEVIASIDTEGALRGNYLFMCAMAAGIAIIGLLLNSPAVIIGAMLVSPLMGPIVRLGLGITTLDHRRAASAALALLAGMGIALLMSITIVWISPVRELTAEILARTRPNLFDLLVATLSGLAGGYAMVRGRGGTIVGVAIATALMPPMAVVGFGIASGHAPVAQGALLLFATNLVAIALSITAVTTWYGFSRRAWRAALAWQTLLGAVLIAPLLVPLLGALQTITREASLQSAVRESIRTAMTDRTFRILSLQVGSAGAGTTSVDLTMALQRYDEDLAAQLRAGIAGAVPGQLTLRFTPVVMAEPERVVVAESAIANPVQPPPELPAPALVVDPVNDTLERFPLRVQASRIDRATRVLRIEIDPSNPVPLSMLRAMEATMTLKLGDWKVELVPPRSTPLRIHFVVNQAELDPARDEDYTNVLWALRRWGVREVRLEGRASSDGDGPAPLAGKRANLVSDLLLRDGVQVFEAVGRYPYPGQAQIEDAVGKHAMRTVLVLPRNSELIDTGESPLGENTDPAATVRPASPGPERTATSGADAGNGTTSIPDSTTNDAAASSADTPALPASGGDAAGARPDEPAEAAPTDDEGSDRDTGTAADGGNDGNQDRAADEDPPADAGDIDVTDTSAGKDDVGRATTVATPGSQSPSSLAAAPPSQQAVSPDDDAHPDRVDPEQFDPEQAKAADATPDVADAATPLSGQAMPSEAQDAGVVDSIAPAETATDGDARGRPVDPDPDAQHD